MSKRKSIILYLTYWLLVHNVIAVNQLRIYPYHCVLRDCVNQGRVYMYAHMGQCSLHVVQVLNQMQVHSTDLEVGFCNLQKYTLNHKNVTFYF